MKERNLYKGAPCIGMTQTFYPPEGTVKHERLELEAEAKAICATCPYLETCRDEGIENETYGIWGGLNSREMSEERRRRGITLRRIAIWAERQSGYKVVIGPFEMNEHNNCGTVAGYHELAAKARMNGGASKGWKVTCGPCKAARAAYESERRIRERKGL